MNEDEPALDQVEPHTINTKLLLDNQNLQAQLAAFKASNSVALKAIKQNEFLQKQLLDKELMHRREIQAFSQRVVQLQRQIQQKSSAESPQCRNKLCKKEKAQLEEKLTELLIKHQQQTQLHDQLQTQNLDRTQQKQHNQNWPHNQPNFIKPKAQMSETKLYQIVILPGQAEIQKEMRRKDKMISDLQQRNNQLSQGRNQRLKKIVQESARLQNEVAKLKAENERLRQSCLDSEKESREVLSRFKDYEQTLQSQMIDSIKANTENKELQLRIRQLEQKLVQRQGVAQTRGDETGRLRLGQELASLQAELRSVYSERDGLLREVAQLRSRWKGGSLPGKVQDKDHQLCLLKDMVKSMGTMLKVRQGQLLRMRKKEKKFLPLIRPV